MAGLSPSHVQECVKQGRWGTVAGGQEVAAESQSWTAPKGEDSQL